MKESRLRILRTQKGFSLKDVSDRLGFSVEFLESLELGNAEMTVTTAKFLAIVYQTSTDYILGLSSNPNITSSPDDSFMECVRMGVEFGYHFGPDALKRLNALIDNEKELDRLVTLSPEERLNYFIQKCLS